ncbi:Golgi-associated RAB2 interactor protein 1A-like isoform X2 [Paroedura picta]|uniref:Golgi-associated RAB2 interactor protein 1A-like isoform X2 n=1 Tax=Paroedura picta TaxID=143630 RepID=UPI004056D619
MAAGASDGKPAAGQKSAWEDGRLSQLLHSSDYNLFPHSAVFESDFVQVTKKGKWVDFSNMPTIVSVGVTSSDPCLPLPNVLLMARRKVLDKGFVEGDSKTPERPVAELNRLLPLRFVRLSVHRDAQRILRLQTVTRKVYYLQLHRDHPKAVFRLWSRLADILKRGLSTTPKDPAIRIQHSLVPSGSSPSGSSSAEPFSDAASPGRPASKQQGRKAPSGDAPAQPRARRREREGRLGPKRVSFQQHPAKYPAVFPGDVSAAPRSVQGFLHNAPPPFSVCTRCERRVPRESREPQSTGQHVGVRRPPPQEPPTSWLQPLSRLWRHTLDTVGRK